MPLCDPNLTGMLSGVTIPAVAIQHALRRDCRAGIER